MTTTNDTSSMPQEYKVSIAADGKLIVTKDGYDVGYDIARWLTKRINDTYTLSDIYPDISLYVGESTEWCGEYKVGISLFPRRRAERLKIELINSVDIDYKLSRSLEKRVHTRLKLLGLHDHGEWFHLDENPEIIDQVADWSNEGDIHEWLKSFEKPIDTRLTSLLFNGLIQSAANNVNKDELEQGSQS